MGNELDEKLKEAIGSAHLTDVEGFTNHVMGYLTEEIKREKQQLSLRERIHRLVAFSKEMLRNHLPQTVGIAVVAAIFLFAFVFGPFQSPETIESSDMLKETSPYYILTNPINANIVETRPCDILPPFLK